MSARSRQIKVTPSMRAALAYLSDETGLSVSALVRKAVDNYRGQSIITPPPEAEVIKVVSWIDDDAWGDVVERAALEGVSASEAIRSQIEKLIGA